MGSRTQLHAIKKTLVWSVFFIGGPSRTLNIKLHQAER